MDDRTLARVATRLIREGVAPRHVRRSVEELRSHRADLIAQLSEQGHDPAGAAAEADARLGSPEQFCEAVLSRPELRGWASRAPWLVFGVMPVAAFAFAAAALVVFLVGYVEVFGPTIRDDAGFWAVGPALLVGGIHWAMPLALLGLLLTVAWRSRISPFWPAAGLLLVATLAATITLQLVGPQGGGKGQLSVGAGYPPRDLLRTVLLFGVAIASVVAIWSRRRQAV